MACWKQIALGVALVLFPYVTHADFVVKGMGMQSCASWTDARSKAQLGSDTLLRLSWVLGFVSAENQRLSVSAPKKVKSFDIAKGLDFPHTPPKRVRGDGRSECCTYQSPQRAQARPLVATA
jgi:hypothetical protein